MRPAGHRGRARGVLEASRDRVHDQAFNVGSPEDNVQVREVAELVRDTVPGSGGVLRRRRGPDLRNYRVDFSKLNETFPDLRLRWGVRDGIENSSAPMPRTA